MNSLNGRLFLGLLSSFFLCLGLDRAAESCDPVCRDSLALAGEGGRGGLTALVPCESCTFPCSLEQV